MDAFTDIQMPGSLDGVAFATWARAQQPGLHVVRVSDVSPAARALCERTRISNKPYDRRMVAERILQLVGA